MFLGNYADIQSFIDYIKSFGSWGIVIYTVIQFIQVLLLIVPGGILTAAGAVIFGFWNSFIISWLSVTLGSMMVFIIARKLGKRVIRKFVKPDKYDRYIAFISDEKRLARTYMAFALIMLFPFFPDDLVCLLAGVTAMRFRTFSLITFFTRPWGLLFSAAYGSQALSFPPAVLVTSVILMFVLGFFAVKYAAKLEKYMSILIHKITNKVRR